jgi:hypothetical protein
MRRDDASAALIGAVQTNCHIADASHATDLSLCIYLLQMRELFRWERGLPFTVDPDRAAVAQWLAEREALWSRLEGRAPLPLPVTIDDEVREFDAADVDGINAALAPRGLVYGAGLAAADRPSYFLAVVHDLRPCVPGLVLRSCGAELARGLFAPPAVLAPGGTIVLRRESLARWLWEKFEAFSLRPLDGPMRWLLDAYGLHGREPFVEALPRLVDDLGQALVLHEIGEHRAGSWLGPAWAAMRLALHERRTDLRVRAVRDHLADLEVTLPALVQRGHEASLHFWFANYDGLRQQLFPSLVQAYAAWRGGDAGRCLLRAAAAAVPHFRALAQQVLGLHERLGAGAGPQIERLLAAPQAVCARAA